MIANAGVAAYGPFAEQSLDAIERMTQVNWLGAVLEGTAVALDRLEHPTRPPSASWGSLTG